MNLDFETKSYQEQVREAIEAASKQSGISIEDLQRLLNIPYYPTASQGVGKSMAQLGKTLRELSKREKLKKLENPKSKFISKPKHNFNRR